MCEKNPKVFISYSQENLEFSDKVLEFSNDLRRKGIDTILDQYEESPLEGWPKWMERSISESDYVIVIGSEKYLNRSTGKEELGIGKGVKWESQIIYQHLYNSDSINERFIPVVFKEEDVKYIPIPLQSSTYYNISSNKRYERLYLRLRGAKTTDKPELGKLAPMPEKERNSLFVTSLIDIATWDKAKWRGAGFYIDVTGTGIPYLLLPFSNEKAAKKIFKDWITVFGSDDKYDEIRIAMIEGDIEGEDKGYTIHISSNLDGVAKRMEKLGMDFDKTEILTFSRMQRANPTDNYKMYNLFKEQYKQHNAYFLAPMLVMKDNSMKLINGYEILKHKLVYRNVKDIDENDEDAPVIQRNKPWKKYAN